MGDGRVWRTARKIADLLPFSEEGRAVSPEVRFDLPRKMPEPWEGLTYPIEALIDPEKANLASVSGLDVGLYYGIPKNRMLAKGPKDKVLFHGTKRDFTDIQFDPFWYATQKHNAGADQLIGPHMMGDPGAAPHWFSNKNMGNIRPYRSNLTADEVHIIPQDRRFRFSLEAAKKDTSNPATNFAIDQDAIGADVANHVFPKSKELFRRWILGKYGDMIYTSEADAVWRKLRLNKEPYGKGIPPHLEMRWSHRPSSLMGVKNPTKMTFGDYVQGKFDAPLLSMDSMDRAEAVDLYRKILLKKGKKAIRYINTFGTELPTKRNNPVSYILLDKSAVNPLYQTTEFNIRTMGGRPDWFTGKAKPEKYDITSRTIEEGLKDELREHFQNLKGGQ